MAQPMPTIIEAMQAEAKDRAQIIKNDVAMSELLTIIASLNLLEEKYGLPRTTLADLFGLELGPVEKQAQRLVSPGDFFGANPLDAAKTFLRFKGKPAQLDEIIAGLKQGSCEIPNREKFRLSLARSTFEIARLNDDTFGLLEWYPHEKEKRAAGNKRRSSSSGSSSDDLDEDSEEASAKAAEIA
jgi:hypothetical protein